MIGKTISHYCVFDKLTGRGCWTVAVNAVPGTNPRITPHKSRPVYQSPLQVTWSCNRLTGEVAGKPTSVDKSRSPRWMPDGTNPSSSATVSYCTTIVTVLLAMPFCVITSGTAGPGVTLLGITTFT